MYAQVSDMLARWPLAEVLIVADDGTGAVNEQYVTQALSDASEEIDSALQQEYELPLPTPFPSMLVRICCDIAMYRMSVGPGRGLNEEKTNRFDRATTELDKLATGKRRLATAPEPPTKETPDFSSDRPRFNRCSMRRLT